MIVAVDSREQAPYSFLNIPRPKAGRRVTDGEWFEIITEVHGLKEGDYSIAGTERLVAVERKSLADLYGTLAGGRERFKAEIERLESYDTAAVVIEASWDEIIRPEHYHDDWKSRLDPRSVFGTIISWSARHPNIHWFPCSGRRLAEITTFEILRKAWDRAEKRIKTLANEETHSEYEKLRSWLVGSGSESLASVAKLMLQDMEVPL